MKLRSPLVMFLVGCLCWCCVGCLHVVNSPLCILVFGVRLRSMLRLYSPPCLCRSVVVVCFVTLVVPDLAACAAHGPCVCNGSMRCGPQPRNPRVCSIILFWKIWCCLYLGGNTWALCLERRQTYSVWIIVSVISSPFWSWPTFPCSFTYSLTHISHHVPREQTSQTLHALCGYHWGLAFHPRLGRR